MLHSALSTRRRRQENACGAAASGWLHNVYPTMRVPHGGRVGAARRTSHPPSPRPRGPPTPLPRPPPDWGSRARLATQRSPPPPPPSVGEGGNVWARVPSGGGGWTNEGRRAAYRGRHDGGGWGALMATSRVRGGGGAGADWTYFNRPYPARRPPSPELPAPSPPITSL